MGELVIGRACSNNSRIFISLQKPQETAKSKLIFIIREKKRSCTCQADNQACSHNLKNIYENKFFPFFFTPIHKKIGKIDSSKSLSIIFTFDFAYQKIKVSRSKIYCISVHIFGRSAK